MRKDSVFRDQVGYAVFEGREAEYAAHLKKLRADPAFQRAMQRAHAALELRARLDQKTLQTSTN
jgi:hypothetical protein